MSFATFDNSCQSLEILSIQFSMAELVNSAKSTNINENISQRYSALETERKNEVIKRIKHISKSCLKASSFTKVTLNPSYEFLKATKILFIPVFSCFIIATLPHFIFYNLRAYQDFYRTALILF